MVPALRGLVCVILYPLEVGPIVAEPDSLAVTPYQRGPLLRPRSEFASDLTTHRTPVSKSYRKSSASGPGSTLSPPSQDWNGTGS